MAEIQQETMPQPYPEHIWQTIFADTAAKAFGIVEENKLLAYAVGCVELQNFQPQGHVLSVAVRKTWQSKGLGKVVLQQLLDHFVATKTRWCYLEVRDNNEAAILFYKRLGFVEQNTVRGYYTNGDGALFMKRFL